MTFMSPQDWAEKYEHNNPSGALVLRKRVLIAGANSFIARGLDHYLNDLDEMSVIAFTRATLDFLNVPEKLPGYNFVYICAAITRFVDCEDDPLAYRVNVDGPVSIARAAQPAKVIYLSSEAVERALHTNYGMHKALAELGLRTVCDPVIARLSKVTKENLEDCCAFLAGLMEKPSGVYHWPAESDTAYLVTANFSAR